MKRPVVLGFGLLALVTSQQAAGEEPVDIAGEIARLRREAATVGLRELRCLEAARAGGTYSTSSTSSSYRSGSASRFDGSDSTARSGGYRSPSRQSTYSSSSTYGSDGRGSSDSTHSTYYSTPEMRSMNCREQARASREMIQGSIRLAEADPKTFAAIVRVSRAQEIEIRAQRAVTFDRGLSTVRQGLLALLSASPPAMGMAAFTEHLAGLEFGLASLWTSAPRESDRTQELEASFEAVQEAIRGFRVARERWTSGEGLAGEVARLEETIQGMRQKLASRPSWVGTAEMEANEHNLRMQRAQLARVKDQSETAWRNAVPAAKAALASLAP